MKVSTNWLRSLTGLDVSTSEIAERLTRSGVEVEAILPVGHSQDSVVVAVVRSLRPHPERERLTIVEVDDGKGTRQVVCGAPNVPVPGGRVALALPGARIGELIVQPQSFRGIESHGMLCSEVELGVGPDASGILVLDDGQLAAGRTLAEALALRDDILELSLTPNRGDCLGHVGLAREVSALFGRTFEMPEPEAPREATLRRIEDAISVTIEDPDRCPRYAAAAVTGLSIGRSPFWLRYRLFNLGIRPISNVVDITNLILLEYGQPLHAFDLDRLRGGRIVVRRARPDESMQTLDGTTHGLGDDDLVICDAEGPVALAGIMGGAGSEIVGSTTRVLIECAYFEPRGILRTARRQHLHTDSSLRFERGVDPAGVPLALRQAASMMTWLGGGSALTGLADCMPTPIEPALIRLRSSRLERVLGCAIDAGESAGILRRLGCNVTVPYDGALDVTAPTARHDLTREVDLIEEVARLRGYDLIPTRFPEIRTGPPTARRYPQLRLARHRLAALGLYEAITYSFVSPRELRAFRLPETEVPLQNPLSEERSVMRTSLLLGLCLAVARARRVREDSVRLFELGRVFSNISPGRGGQAVEPAPPPYREQVHAAFVLAGPREAYLARGASVDFFDAKGLCTAFCRAMTGREPSVMLDPESAPHLHPRSACIVELEGVSLGRLGEVHPDVVDALDLGGPIVAAELDLDVLETVPRDRRLRPIPRFPAIVRDVALLVDESVRYADIEAVARRKADALLEQIEIFDLYRGEQIPAGRKSMALSLRYRSQGRTLTDGEVDSVHAEVLAGFARELGGQPR